MYKIGREHRHLQNLVGNGTIAKESHHTLYALVRSLLIVILRALDCVKQPISIIWDSFKCVMNSEREPDIK